MKPEELHAKYGGVVAFPVTPFRDDLSLDIEGLRQNLTRLMNHPVCAVVAAGGTGEVYSLTRTNTRKLSRRSSRSSTAGRRSSPE